MSLLAQELRFALRLLARNCGFTAVAVVTLALGIGANTAVFSVVEGVLLRALPYAEPDRMVEVWNHWNGSDQAWMAPPELAAYREGTSSFASFVGYVTGSVNLGRGVGGGGGTTGAARPERVRVAATVGDVFAVFGVEPERGRGFTAEESVPGGPAAVVLSHELWARRFGSDPGVVGSAILVDGEPTTVVGVLPAGVLLPEDHRTGTRTEVWMPLPLDADVAGNWGTHFLVGLARLAPGVPRERAQADLDRVVAAIKTDHRGSRDAVGSDSFGAALHPVREQVVGGFRTPLLILMAAAGLVLLIACANVANLMLARAEARRSEIALRAYLGASHGRLARQLLTESLVLAAAGGAAGLALANGALELLRAIAPANLPRLAEIRIDPLVLVVTAGLSIAAGVAMATLPALQGLGAGLRDSLAGGRGAATAGSRGGLARSALVVVEVAVAVTVVAGAGLLAKSYWQLSRVDPGFRPDNVLSFELDLPPAAYPESTDVLGFYAELERRVGALPGAAAVGAVNQLPLTGGMGDWNFYPEGRTYPENDQIPRGDWHVVTPGYLDAVAIAVRAGRGITAADDAEAPLVALVNEEAVRRYWGGSSPVGGRFRLGGRGERPMLSVVGVVADVRQDGLDAEPHAEIYLPIAQMPRAMQRDVLRSVSVAVRTSVPPLRLADGVRAAVAAIDPALPIADLRTLEQVRAESLAQPRFSTSLIGLFALLALTLGAVGIFGVMSYLAARRRQEIGIRMALGASRGGVVRLVASQAMRPALVGLALGVGGALAGGRALAGQLFGTTAADPAVLVAVPLVLGAVALAAALVPARRAAATEPVTVLRSL